jgi:superfamily I DNA/RNA helicase
MEQPAEEKHSRTLTRGDDNFGNRTRRDCPVIWLTEPGKDARRRIAEAGVKILTMHGSKGLQFKAVVLLFMDDCPGPFMEAEERRLFFVGLTRAEDYLVISSTGKSKFISEIESRARAQAGERNS